MHPVVTKDSPERDRAGLWGLVAVLVMIIVALPIALDRVDQVELRAAYERGRAAGHVDMAGAVTEAYRVGCRDGAASVPEARERCRPEVY